MKIKVHIKNSFLGLGNLQCGVPQGFIFRQLLFMLYINYIPQTVDCELWLYADDTCLILQHKDIAKTKMTLNKNFSMFSYWSVDDFVWHKT